jgi:hypothetical protein
MGNGGSPPAHLPLSSLSDPLAWLQYKWLQPPPRAPDWVFDIYQKFNPPADVGCPLRDKEWLQRAFCEDKQAAGILPPDPPGGPILLGARARAERAYLDWKWTVATLWEDERHCLQTAARQRHLDKETACQRQAAAAARVRQEAACCQQLLDEQATHARQEAVATRALQEAAATCALQEAAAARACQEAARHQQLLDKEAACARCQEAARFQQLLDEQAARARQEAAAAAACARQDADDACTRQEASEFDASMASLPDIMAELQRAAEALALVEERCRHEAVLAAEADNRRCHEATARAAEALALDEECCRHEAVLAAEGNNQRRHEVAARAAEALILVEECRHHKAATRASLSTVSPLADEQSCHKAAAGDTALAKLALAVCPRAQPCHHTGRRNILRAPSSFIEVAPTHPELLQGGLTTPPSTTLAGATSPCCSVVDEQRQAAAAREKALANKTDEQRQAAAAWEKAWRTRPTSNAGPTRG